ncbi:DUF177 domain-containing protein [Candidatus Hepatincolaceae symbiont of Richtersius coronifer]
MPNNPKLISLSSNRLLDINKLNNNKKNINIKANDIDLASLVSILEILSLKSLKFKCIAFKEGKLITLEGLIKASIIQACGITLESIKSDLKISFTRLYQQAEGKKSTNKIDRKNGNSKELTFPINDEIDLIEGQEINLQDLIIEELILAIDPFIKANQIKIEQD